MQHAGTPLLLVAKIERIRIRDVMALGVFVRPWRQTANPVCGCDLSSTNDLGSSLLPQLVELAVSADTFERASLCSHFSPDGPCIVLQPPLRIVDITPLRLTRPSSQSSSLAPQQHRTGRHERTAAGAVAAAAGVASTG